MSDLCPCGQPLHYTNADTEAYVRMMVAMLGECIEVKVLSAGDVYLVPRHFIALHGITARGLPELAKRYGFKKVGGSNGEMPHSHD